jgi:nuclear pore complex protein Nup98-Nup96
VTFLSVGFGAQAGQGQGSYIKYTPTNTGMDTMIKNGVSNQVNTRHQTITLMKEYENKSMEVRFSALKISDYRCEDRNKSVIGAIN